MNLKHPSAALEVLNCDNCWSKMCRLIQLMWQWAFFVNFHFYGLSIDLQWRDPQATAYSICHVCEHTFDIQPHETNSSDFSILCILKVRSQRLEQPFHQVYHLLVSSLAQTTRSNNCECYTYHALNHDEAIVRASVFQLRDLCSTVALDCKGHSTILDHKSCVFCLGTRISLHKAGLGDTWHKLRTDRFIFVVLHD